MLLYSPTTATVMAVGYSARGTLFLGRLRPSATAFRFIDSGASGLLVFLLYAAGGSRLGQGSLVLLSGGLLLTAVLVLRALLSYPRGQGIAVLLAANLCHIRPADGRRAATIFRVNASFPQSDT